jgi:hypothetical protein
MRCTGMKRGSPFEDVLKDLDRVLLRFSVFLIQTDACTVASLLDKSVRNGAKYMKDQRRFERYNIDVHARIELITSCGKRKVIESHVANLSAVGGFFPHVKSLPLVQLLKVDIFLPFERPNPSLEEHQLITMTVTGQVVRSGSSGTAVAFAEEYRLTSCKIFKRAKETKNSILKKRAEGGVPCGKGK